MHSLKRVLWTFLAVCFLIVSWIWDTLGPLIRAGLDLIPLENLKRLVINFIDRLPPYPTLFVFLIPLIVIEPIKLAALWFFAQKQWLIGMAFFISGEVLRFGLVAFLFKSCKEKLLTIGWFAQLYALFDRAHRWAHAQVDPIKAAIKQLLIDSGLIGGRGPLLQRVRALWRLMRAKRARS